MTKPEKGSIFVLQYNEDMANLFNKAKQVAPKKAAKKDEKVRINITDSDFFSKVQTLEQLNDSMRNMKAQADMISDEVRDLAKDAWVNLYSDTGKNPGSVVVYQDSFDETAQLMFVPTDKYITITADRAEELQSQYGSDIVEEETTFSFDSDMIEKYGEVLSSLIMNCDDISDSDKERIIKASTKFSVAKGTLDKLNKYGEVSEVMEAVRPVVALKNIEVVKS